MPNLSGIKISKKVAGGNEPAALKNYWHTRFSISTIGLDWLGEKLATAWAKVLEVLHQLCSSTAQEVEPQVPLSMPAHVSVCIDTQSTFSLLLQNHSSIQGGTRAFPLKYTRPTAGISLYKAYIFHKRRHPGHKPLPFTLHQMYLSSPDSHKFQQLCKRQKVRVFKHNKHHGLLL